MVLSSFFAERFSTNFSFFLLYYGSTDKFSIILTHLFCPHIVDKSYT